MPKGGKLTIEEVRDIVEGKGYELLSDEYVNKKAKLKIKDRDGYISLSSLDSIKQSLHFLRFHESNPYTIQNIKHSIKTEYPKLLSEQFVNSRSKLKWLCECGGIFERVLHKVISDKRLFCSKCSYSKSKIGGRLDIGEVREFIENNSNCRLLSEVYTRGHDLLSILCDCGDGFEVSFSNFKNHNVRQCKKCSGKNRLTIDEVREVLNEKGYTLLDEEYKRMDENISIMDSDGFCYYSKLYNLMNEKVPRKCHKTNIYSIKNIRHFLKLNFPEYDLLSKTYLKSNQELILKTNEGYKCVSTASSLFGKFKPTIFIANNPYTIENIKLWCKLNDSSLSLISKKYIDNRKDLKWRCNDCGETVYSNWGTVQSGSKCSYCTNRKVGKTNCLAIINPELSEEWNVFKNGSLTPYDVLAGTHIKVWWKCRNCNHEWETSPSKRHHCNRGCPLCRISRAELKVETFLKRINIPFEFQKTFSGLVGLGYGNLSYDFYLPQYNLLCECQGQFHDKKLYEEHDFERQKEHDRRKREYAKNNNIKLLEIWYWDFNNIEEIIVKELELDLNLVNT